MTRMVGLALKALRSMALASVQPLYPRGWGAVSAPASRRTAQDEENARSNRRGIARALLVWLCLGVALTGRAFAHESQPGLLELRQALAKNLHRLYGVDYDPSGEILVSVGDRVTLVQQDQAPRKPGGQAADLVEKTVSGRASSAAHRSVLLAAAAVSGGCQVLSCQGGSCSW